MVTKQAQGLKRRRGALIAMAAKGGDVDHIETAYGALAQQGTIKIGLGEKTMALQMTTKEDKAQMGMLTQEEGEIQDNIQTIANNNRNQVKAIGFKGITHDTTSNYEKETNELLLIRTRKLWEGLSDRTPYSSHNQRRHGNLHHHGNQPQRQRPHPRSSLRQQQIDLHRSNGQRNKHQIWKKRTGAHRTTDEKW
jgi:hypothetical protein